MPWGDLREHNSLEEIPELAGWFLTQIWKHRIQRWTRLAEEEVKTENCVISKRPSSRWAVPQLMLPVFNVLRWNAAQSRVLLDCFHHLRSTAQVSNLSTVLHLGCKTKNFLYDPSSRISERRHATHKPFHASIACSVQQQVRRSEQNGEPIRSWQSMLYA